MAVFGAVNRYGRGAEHGHVTAIELHRKVVGYLSAHAHDDSSGCLEVDDVHDALKAELIEVEAVAHVVVGRHGFGVVVDHYRLVAELAAGAGCIYRAPVKLYRTTDAVGTRAEHHDVVAGVEVVTYGVLLGTVGDIEVVGEVGIFRSDGVDAAHLGKHFKRLAVSAHTQHFALHGAFGVLHKAGYLEVGESKTLGFVEHFARQILDFVILFQLGCIGDDVV